MRSAVIAILLASAIAGCATEPIGNPQADQFRAWSEATRSRAESGEVKFSDYYTEGYNRLAAINDPSPEKTAVQRAFAELIPIARSYEAGTITRDQLDDARRLKNMDIQQQTAAAAADRQRAEAEALERWSDYLQRTRPSDTTCFRQGFAVSCTTR